jgi:hypothetical protein
MHQFLKFIFGIKLYMFRTVPLSIIRSFSLYTQQWYLPYRFADSLRAGSGQNQFRPDPAGKLSADLYDIYHCCVYSVKLFMMVIIIIIPSISALAHLISGNFPNVYQHPYLSVSDN